MRLCAALVLVPLFSLTVMAVEPLTVPVKLQGSWTATTAEFCGKMPPADIVGKLRVIFKEKTIAISDLSHNEGKFYIEGEPVELGCEINPKTKELDLISKDGDKEYRMLGIYAIEGETLKVCWQHDGKARPKEFKTVESPTQMMMILKRTKEK
jgi:uncharacterized protein (TIGR03067 family)